MKLLCIDDKIDGVKSQKITFGKTYAAFSTLQADHVGVLYSNSTCLTEDDIRFLIFDDEKKWSLWSPVSFVPAEDWEIDPSN
jgi:hypothetical protein